MRKIFIIAFTFTAILWLLPSCIQEGKIYETEKSLVSVIEDIREPDFITEEIYSYKKTLGVDRIFHTYTLKEPSRDYPADEEELIRNLEKIRPSVSTLPEILNLFGKPPRVIIATNTSSEYQNYHLNLQYNDFTLYFGSEKETLIEIRIEDETSIYAYDGKIKYGQSLDYVLSYMPATEIIEGEEIDWEKSGVLFKNIEGRESLAYIDYKDKRIRMFFNNNRLSALYLY
ncbi:hypothetical protein [Spirochaeta isovalerica]|uniref:Uncharacterized protein n=1 Tax=Spirochaeta isovalerica TaxID=150 RepID=A0A841RB29_9SPIO|nr:hypothetical protein [Spirochaeta isovalerica]MBB6480916.1 hypothetical protein [Spirochaeta isovalerica]